MKHLQCICRYLFSVLVMSSSDVTGRDCGHRHSSTDSCRYVAILWMPKCQPLQISVRVWWLSQMLQWRGYWAGDQIIQYPLNVSKVITHLSEVKCMHQLLIFHYMAQMCEK